MMDLHFPYYCHDPWWTCPN